MDLGKVFSLKGEDKHDMQRFRRDGLVFRSERRFAARNESISFSSHVRLSARSLAKGVSEICPFLNHRKALWIGTLNETRTHNI